MNELMTKKEIKEAIRRGIAKPKHAKYSVPITVHPRDKIIAKAQIDKSERLRMLRTKEENK